MPVIRLDKEYLGRAPKDPTTGKALDHWAVLQDGPEQTAIAIPRGALLHWVCPDIDGGMPLPFAIVQLHVKRGVKLRCWCGQKNCTLELEMKVRAKGRHPKIVRDL